ncbi:MAG: histidine kinase dimerization/phospho-acceptor domain-containing protein [Pseudomonadota bacterium]
MKFTLQTKVAVAMWLMATASTIAAAIVTGSLLIQSHRDSIHQQLQATTATLMSLGIQDFAELEDFNQLNSFIESALQMDRVDKVIRIFDKSNKLIYTTAGEGYDLLPDMLRQRIDKPVFETIDRDMRDYESLTVPYLGRKHMPLYLQVVIPLPKYSDIMEGLWPRMLIVLGVLIALSIALARFIATRLLKPVTTISNHLSLMNPEAADQWTLLNMGGHGQYLHDIIDGINNLIKRTRATMFRMQRMSRYVAHELRTPLTILQGEAEIALQKQDATVEDFRRTLMSSLEEIQRIAGIVDAVMQLGDAAVEKNLYQPYEFELVQWLDDHISGWEKLLGRKIQFSAAEKIDVRTDPRLLFPIIDNLIRNIKKHTSPSTGCALSIAKDREETAIVLEDEGPGLSCELIDALNDRNDFTDSIGVGLSLCIKIANLCGLKLLFANRAGDGLSVSIVFSELDNVS